MRLSSFALLAGVAGVTQAQSLDKDAINSKKATTFNGVKVPPLLEITPNNFEEELTKTKYLMVKHYRYFPPLFFQSLHETDTRQPILPTLHRLCSDLPNPLRVLLHVASRSDSRYKLHRIL